MFAGNRSRSFDGVGIHLESGATMHPTLMTMIADDRAASLRAAAPSQRRGTVVRGGARRFFSLRRPRRAARLAHV
jgi:hypothetical protein